MAKKELKDGDKVTKEQKDQTTKDETQAQSDETKADSDGADTQSDETPTPPDGTPPIGDQLAEIKESGFVGSPLAGKLPTSDKRTFLARGVKGRDGTGPCKVLGKYQMRLFQRRDPKTRKVVKYEERVLTGGNIYMPNGDLAVAGDTFDPIAEGMSLGRYNRYVDGKYISGNDQVKKELTSAEADES